MTDHIKIRLLTEALEAMPSEEAEWAEYKRWADRLRHETLRMIGEGENMKDAAQTQVDLYAAGDAEAKRALLYANSELLQLRSEIEAYKITLESLWHFAMCNFDHCQRCINDESIIKDLRDRFSLKSESDD